MPVVQRNADGSFNRSLQDSITRADYFTECSVET